MCRYVRKLYLDFTCHILTFCGPGRKTILIALLLFNFIIPKSNFSYCRESSLIQIHNHELKNDSYHESASQICFLKCKNIVYDYVCNQLEQNRCCGKLTGGWLLNKFCCFVTLLVNLWKWLNLNSSSVKGCWFCSFFLN